MKILGGNKKCHELSRWSIQSHHFLQCPGMYNFDRWSSFSLSLSLISLIPSNDGQFNLTRFLGGCDRDRVLRPCYPPKMSTWLTQPRFSTVSFSAALVRSAIVSTLTLPTMTERSFSAAVPTLHEVSQRLFAVGIHPLSSHDLPITQLGPHSTDIADIHHLAASLFWFLAASRPN